MFKTVTRAMEDFWDSLNSGEAKCLKSLLDGAALFQLQLQQNEQLLHETKDVLAAKEAVCERLQRSAHRASQRSERATHVSAAMHRELGRLKEAHDAGHSHGQLEELRQRRGELQREEAQVANELMQHQVQAQDLRERLASAKHRCHERRGDLEGLRERCLQEKLQQKEIHAQDLDKIREETEIAMEKLKLKDVEREQLALEFAEEVKALRAVEQRAHQRQAEAQEKREEAAEELAKRLQEGNVLRDFCRETHQEVAQLSSHLRAHPDGEEPLDSDSEVEREVQELQQRCHFLERQCAHSQAAASRRPFAKLKPNDLSFAENSADEPLILEGPTSVEEAAV